MQKKGLFQHILLAGLIAGMLDILAAILILAKGNATGTLRYIASGAFGAAAFSGGTDMLVWGIVFHFLIALSFAAGYFLVYPYLPVLKKSKWVSLILFGLFIWTTMNYFVLPLTHTPPAAFSWKSALRSIMILTICVSGPVVWLAERFYKASRAIQ